MIGIWVLLGFCTVLLLTGMTKIDPALYESARIDGAGLVQEFRSITVPSLRYEIGVCLTVTVIAALAAFDIVYVSTGGGPGNATAVPGIQIYILAFLERQVGLASALAVVLVILVLIVILPIQRLTRGERTMRVARREVYAGRALLVALMAVTILPFVSIFTTALIRPGSVPSGLDWPADPQWGNFFEAFKVANMSALLGSSVFIVLAVVPDRAPDLHDGRLRHRLSAHPRRRVAAAAVRVRADPAVRGDHHPALLPGTRRWGSSTRVSRSSCR